MIPHTNYKIRNIIVICIVFTYHIAVAQKINPQDTIYLPEVVVTQYGNEKLKKISNLGKSGRVSFSSVMPSTLYANKIVTQGCMKIQKVVFYVKKKSNSDAHETFELLFFSVGKDGFPEKRLHNETLFFQLFTADKVEINLEAIDLPLCREFFIVIQKTLNEGTSESDYIILGNNHKKSQTFVKVKDRHWHKLDKVNLKLDIYYTESKRKYF